MGSKHALLDHGGLLLPPHGARWPPRPMLAALAAGFLLGLLLGRWHHGHNQVVLVEHLVAGGERRGRLWRRAFGQAACSNRCGPTPAAACCLCLLLHSRGC